MNHLRQTHTYAELGLSEQAYNEIESKLREADYGHAFMEDGTIDMHGIGVTKARKCPQWGKGPCVFPRCDCAD